METDGAIGEGVVFLEHFRDLRDPRQAGKVVYPLDEILLLCLLAVLAGAETFTDIARFGTKKLDLLRRFLHFRDGTPAHDQRGAYRPHAQLPDIGAVEACAFGFMPLADTDSDSIPDCLEPAYQMTVGIDDSQRDSDGDGSPDAEEIANMTDPLDGSSLLKILSLTPAGAGAPGEFVVSFTAFPGLSYTLECDQNLDFHGPTARVIPLGTAIDFIGNTQVELMPEKDFIRIRRNP